MKSQHTLNLSLAVSLTLLLTACPAEQVVDAAEQAADAVEQAADAADPPKDGFTAPAKSFSRSLPDRNVNDFISGCSPGDQRLTAQTLSGTATLTLDLGGNSGLNRIVVEDGVYEFAIQLRSPLDCAPIPGAVGPPLRVEFELVYTGAVEDFGDGLCVTSSKVAFSAFVFSGAPFLDGWLEAAVRDQVLRSLDMTHIDMLPTVTLAAGSDGRCSNWDPLD